MDTDRFTSSYFGKGQEWEGKTERAGIENSNPLM